MRFRNRGILLCFTMLLLLSAGCGKKTAPIPPDAATPGTISDLRYTLEAEHAILTWSYPQKSVTGEDVENIRYFTLYRSALTEEDYCSDCPANYVQKQKVDPGLLAPGEKISVTIEDFSPGRYYSYKVTSHAGWNIVSADSNEIAFWWDNPAQSPEGLTVQVGDKQLDLSWQPVAAYAGGEALDGPVVYQVYRRTGEKKFSPVGELLTQPRFMDSGLTNGTEYFYQVQARHIFHDTTIPGGLSTVVSAVPRDITPPPPPMGLSSVMMSDGLKIVWNSVKAPDLAGYRVYRRVGEGQWKLIGETSAGAFSFKDANLPAEANTWYYAVKSFDRASPPNESSFSRELVIEINRY